MTGHVRRRVHVDSPAQCLMKLVGPRFPFLVLHVSAFHDLSRRHCPFSRYFIHDRFGPSSLLHDCSYSFLSYLYPSPACLILFFVFNQMLVAYATTSLSFAMRVTGHERVTRT